jgi:hypothetical protein
MDDKAEIIQMTPEDMETSVKKKNITSGDLPALIKAYTVLYISRLWRQAVEPAERGCASA